ncbi:MAG: hypothetical protein EOM24_27400 [Chloroflexia bacterium]|nr:hypothetical protein [Chloroflexia bacterium]
MLDDQPEDQARVLVVIVPQPRDLNLARDEGWYRVPLAHTPAQFAADYLAFYQTAAFGDERWSVRFYAEVLRYTIQTRRELLPGEPDHPRANERYYRVTLGPLRELPLPIPSARLRRVVFIATTFGQLRRASDLRDLYHPDEDNLPDDDLWGAGLAGRTLR